MNHGPTPDKYPQLPGPARFISDIAADLGSGKSVVVVFPDAVVDSGIADAILHDLATEGFRAEFCQESSERFPARILATFGSFDPLSEFDEWDSIIGWEPWHGAWVLIPGWVHTDVAEVVDRWPAQLKACGLSVEDRPKLVIAVRLADLPRKTITHLDRDNVSVHWWWGVLDRLDTETRLAAVSPRRLSPVDAAVVSEVSAWDLRCTDFLAAQWDRTTSGLPDAVRQYRQQVVGVELSRPWPTPRARHGIPLPPIELEQFWRDGLVDRWGHSIRQAPHTLTQPDVTQRLWMAHNRILIPHVDDERAAYERLIMPKASSAALEDLRRRDDDIIEIGSLAWLVDTGRVDIGREARLRLRAFRDLRNDLAHRKPLSDKLLRCISDHLGL